MEDMESQIDAKYKGYEEEDTEGPEDALRDFENETPPPVVESNYGNFTEKFKQM